MATFLNLNRLILFTRFPQPGTTKTRLAPVLGSQGAADLQREMTEHVTRQIRAFTTRHPMAVDIRFAGGTARQMQKWLGRGFNYDPQGTGHIGKRMRAAFADAFATGAAAAVLIGSDVPGISALGLKKAFLALKRHPMVVGPAADGGYYLIGLRADTFSRIGRRLFDDCNWGGGTIFAETMRRAGQDGRRGWILEKLADVDRPEDLPVWRQALRRGGRKGISVIVPVLDEEQSLKQTLESVSRGRHREVIVVDGGSRDGTVRLARAMGATVLSGVPPRSRQMNQGAAAAAGDTLLFLHGDTRLPKGWDDAVDEGVAMPGVAAGAFSLCLDSAARSMRLVGRLATWRSRCLSLPYGDQALFVSAERFWAAGGFADMPIMEDFELVRRLKKMGGRVTTLPAAVTTSPRRWTSLGVLKTTLVNQMVVAAYFAGTPPAVLARWYRSGRLVPGPGFFRGH